MSDFLTQRIKNVLKRVVNEVTDHPDLCVQAYKVSQEIPEVFIPYSEVDEALSQFVDVMDDILFDEGDATELLLTRYHDLRNAMARRSIKNLKEHVEKNA